VYNDDEVVAHKERSGSRRGGGVGRGLYNEKLKGQGKITGV